MKHTKTVKVLLIPSLIALLLCGCMSQTAKQTIEDYNRVLEEVQRLERLIPNANNNAFTGEELFRIYTTASELYYDYNPMDLDEKQKTLCEDLKTRLAKLRNEITDIAKAQISNIKIAPCTPGDKLLEKKEVFPVYLKRGEKLCYILNAQKPMTVKVIDYNSRATLKTYTVRTLVKDSLTIQHDAIYLVDINPQGTQYVDVDISYKVNDISRLRKAAPIKSERVECSKGDFGAEGVPGISMQKVFEQPRKFTLRSQFKAAFSGSPKALVAIPVPTGATDILYSMRIDTDESDRSSDGKFHDDMNVSYQKIKFLGLPIYERTGSSGLINSLLNDNRPIRDEDAYCNMYVFRSQTQAKHFQDGTKGVSQLNYDVDYSTLGTQSSNGRIPVNGAKTIYLGFENERIRYTNYLWVEADVVVPNTTYYTTKYTIDK